MDYKNWNPPKGQLEIVNLGNRMHQVMRCINGVPVEKDQPERLNPETCDHSGINIMQYLDEKSKKCMKCDAILTRCDSLTSMET